MTSFLVCEADSKGGSENSPVDCFPAVGESLNITPHPRGMWRDFDCREVFFTVEIRIAL